jgi:hypothetical protein
LYISIYSIWLSSMQLVKWETEVSLKPESIKNPLGHPRDFL